jgi:hypothetical protein
MLGTAACALLAGPAMASSSSQTDARLDQMQMMIQQQNQEIQQMKADEANEASTSQQYEATQAQVGSLQDKVNAVSDADKGAWWHDTKVSGRMYFDMTDLEQKTNGSDVTKQNGIGFDIKRFYIGVDHKFDDVWSANVTTDFLYDSSAGATQLYIKKAYLDGHFDDAFDVKLGSTDMPWIPFAEGIYGYRYVENTLIDRIKLGNSADWGAHFSGKFAGGMFNYAVSVINGAGYKSPPGAGNAVKFKTIDVEGRVSAKIDNITLAVGGYDGKLGKDVQGAVTHHTATRFNALAAYTDDAIRVGVEYFSANDYLDVTSTATDKDSGYSGFASYKFDPQWAVFGRYDWVQEKTTNSSILKPRDGYYNAGIEWSPSKIVSLSLVYKHDSENHGALSEQNGSGTLGSTSGLKTGTFNEVGIFGLFQW